MKLSEISILATGQAITAANPYRYCGWRGGAQLPASQIRTHFAIARGVRWLDARVGVKPGEGARGTPDTACAQRIRKGEFPLSTPLFSFGELDI